MALSLDLTMALSMERTMILVPLTMDGSMDYLAMAPSMDLAMDDCIDYLTMVLSMDIPWTLQWTF